MNFYIYVAVMAVVTYLVRMVPLVLADKEIKNVFFRSFLHYVPYAALASMTFPAILFSTSQTAAAIAGFIVAVFMALREKSLIVVAVAACITVFAVEQIMELIL